MGLFEQLNDDMKQAMRDKNTAVRDTLRMVLAGVKNLRIELGREPNEDDVLAVLQRGVKTRKDSIDQYQKAGREDLAAIEIAELEVLSAYLPQALSKDELRTIVQDIIAELGLESKRDMGKLMKAVISRHGAAADGKIVSGLAGELLS